MSSLVRAVCGLAAVIMGACLVLQATPIRDQLGTLIGGVGVVIGLIVFAYYGARYLTDRHHSE